MLALRFGLATLAVVGGLGLAVAQQGENLASPQQKNQQEKAQHTDEGRAGTTEPSSQTPTTQRDESWVFENGRLNTPGAPADSQTVPSTVSERNAALDKLPTMAFPLPFTDEQRQRIRDAVSKAPVEGATAQAAELLPSGINVRELPRQITDQIPAARNLGYVRTVDKILLISPPNRIVVGEIAN
jgi:methylmalonyl-CoA mutase N-terminal domain/subunit